ncbi:MAG TPA: PP2C family protein-serine/threonine phosphatase, partial [Geobacteraceae bacterium]
ENSRMLRDMELARQIQLSLLPTSPPRVSGVGLAGCCVPAAHVGGDYYDYYSRAPGIVDVVVADVSGHSIGAALMTAEARSALRAQLATGDSAGEVLAALNRTLHNDLDRSELFITLFCASYAAASRTLTYANAGHVSPLLLRRGEAACRWLDAEGLILGVREEVTFEEKRLQLEEGDVLLFYTDGVTEARNTAGELFGPGRLCSILRRRHDESPQAVLDAVLAEIAVFTGSSVLEDDVTMVVMKVE